MNIGDTEVVHYMGVSGGEHLFTTKMFSELIKVKEAHLFGKSVLVVSQDVKLTRQSLRAYVALPA